MASYSACAYSTLPNVSLGPVDLSTCTSENNYDVNVSLTISEDTVSLDAYYEWKMYLQRYSNGAWTTIASRTGYISTDSPSHRTFTNIGVLGQKVRVKVNYYYEGGEFVATRYSNTWTR